MKSITAIPDAAPLGILSFTSKFLASGNKRMENNTANTSGITNSAAMIIKKPKAITDINIAAKRREKESGFITGIDKLFAVVSQ